MSTIDLRFISNGFSIEDVGPLYTDESGTVTAEDDRLSQVVAIRHRGYQLVDKVCAFIMNADDADLNLIRKAKDDE